MAPSADHLDTANPAVVGAGQAINPPFTDADSNALEQLGASGEEWTRPHSNLWVDAFRRLIRNRLALIGLIIVTLFVLIAIFAPLLAPYGQSEVVDVRVARMGPSWTWPMGLDKNGRDIFSRLMWGLLRLWQIEKPPTYGGVNVAGCKMQISNLRSFFCNQ